ncbi:MAG: prephenate dehydrogenase/arogenate dehydrogenase family protein [Actinomycetia bacterium]|nr:prephenate dehydrogenase/arogenate dehydrogenase family protein [Actinomycetes bacterium]
MTRRAMIIGTGLIGGSVGIALRDQGWHVSAVDHDPEVAKRAVDLGAADVIGQDPDAELTVVATPVGAIPGAVHRALEITQGVVTDVGSVKATVATAVTDGRFVPGHPMAGSEQDGIEGAVEGLFDGATWVLCPSQSTDDSAYAAVRSIVASLGAEIVALEPKRHDELVAVVSHVPHLTAATLMGVASDRSFEHRALLRLAAGGFRDMTRISAGRPDIWPDICAENRVAIVEVLDTLLAQLGQLRSTVVAGDRDGLLEVLERARIARRNLPVRAVHPGKLTEVQVPVFDRPGELRDITTLAAELDVNIYDFEITHSAEGRRGIVHVIVDTAVAERLQGGLMAQGYRPSLRALDAGEP